MASVWSINFQKENTTNICPTWTSCLYCFVGGLQSFGRNLQQVPNGNNNSLSRCAMQQMRLLDSQKLLSHRLLSAVPMLCRQPILTTKSGIFTSLRNKLCPNQELQSSFGARFLPTLNQYRRGKARTKKDIPEKYIPKAKRILLGPQRKGVCLKVFTRKPKKPNSGNRKCALLKLSNGKVITAYIPGEGAVLQEHGVVLFEGGRVQDCPGIKYKIIRRKYDMN